MPDPSAAFDLESGERATVAHGKRPEVKAEKAKVVQRYVNGIMTNVGVPAVAARPEGAHRLLLSLQGDAGAVPAYLTPREAYILGEKLIEVAAWLEEQVALEEARAKADALAAAKVRPA